MEEQNNQFKMPLIGDDAPGFQAKTTQGEINFPGDYQGKWVVLFCFW
jgi:peroxiredoxin (alkyl hydroperoxide reductase subunit C)